MLKDGARSAGKHRGGGLSSALVVFQFALTLVLLSGAGVFVHSLMQSLSANRSVPADQMMTARIDFPEERYKDTDCAAALLRSAVAASAGASRRDPCGHHVEPARAGVGGARCRD